MQFASEYLIFLNLVYGNFDFLNCVALKSITEPQHVGESGVKWGT